MSGMIEMLPYLVAGWLALIGLYGMATSRNIIHLVMCFAVFQTSVWVLLLTGGFHSQATAPIYDEVAPDATVTDPVMQAISITDIVVGAAVIAILLALAVQIHKRMGSLDPDQFTSIKG